MTEPKITLKAARVNADLTLDEVAERIGKSKQTIVNWEKGITPIKYSDLIKLLELYEMPVEYIRVPE
jgi:transcriptional regulator with XRE-family HTH domain